MTKFFNILQLNKKKFKFLDQKLKNCNLFIPRPPRRTSKRQEKPFSPQKRRTSGIKISLLYPIFVGHFCPAGNGNADPYSADQNQCGSIVLLSRSDFELQLRNDLLHVRIIFQMILYHIQRSGARFEKPPSGSGSENRYGLYRADPK